MSINKKLTLLFVAVFLSGCATAPFTEEHTARPLGKGHSEWTFSKGYRYSSGGFNKGVSDKLDIGAIIEVQNGASLMGLSGKYLLTPKSEESPLSLLLGLGFGVNSKYAYVGLIKSYRVTPSYELAFNSRFNVFDWDFGNDIDDSEDAENFISRIVDGVLESIDGTHTYVSVDVSNTFWMNPKLGVTLSVGGIGFVGRDSGSGLKGGLKFHFNY